jgi:hypothetical protein
MPNTMRVEQRLQARGHRDARGQPDRGRDDAHDGRLGEHRAENLALAGTQRPQEAILPGALGHRDRERVEDHEGADQQRDDREDQHEGVEEGQGLLERVLHLLGDGRPGHRFQPVRQHVPQVGGQLLLRNTRTSDEQDAGELPGRGDEALRDRRGEQGDAGAARAVRGPEPDDPHHPVPLRRA